MISGLFSLPLSPLAPPPAAVSRGGVSRAAPARAGDTGPSQSFVAGPENVLVRTLARAVTGERMEFNPLVLCGPTGVGKTSLAHALAAQRRDALSLENVVTTTGDDFARGLGHAIDSDAVADFRARYHQCDLLVIDEVHRLAEKTAAQQFLVIALDALMLRGAFVIVTLPRPPQATTSLSPALASRLAGGLIVPLQPPGLEARHELVRQFAQHVDLQLSNDLAAQLAGATSPAPTRMLTAPRLRHAVLQLAATGDLHPRSANRSTRPSLVGETSESKAVIRQVLVVVGKHFDVTLTELKGKSRRQHIADARGLAMFLARRLTACSYASIGRCFGKRDHSTVLHACRKTERMLTGDDALRRLLDELTGLVTASEAL